MRPQIAAYIEKESVFIATEGDTIIGAVTFCHRKRDLQTTLYSIAVHHEHRGKGIGKALVNKLIDSSKEMGRQFILLKCPEGLPSNDFYAHIGCVKMGVQKPRKETNRSLNIWQINL